MLEPGTYAMEQRILPIKVGTVDMILNPDAGKTVSDQPDLVALLNNELAKNFNEPGTDSWGFLNLTLTYGRCNSTGDGEGLLFFNAFTLFAPGFIGIPLTEDKCYFQVDIAILNSQKRVVKRYAYKEEEIVQAGFYNDIQYRKKRLAVFSMTKRVIGRLKNDLSKDINEVNNSLKTAGVLGAN